MSEYQYYEFRTIGRTLDEAARRELKELSRRAIVTSTQAIYTYSYSDFGYDSEAILADHFDIMLYMNNFGTKQLMFRFPVNLIDQELLKPYCVSDVISYSLHDQSLILNFNIWEEEGSGWVDGEGLLDELETIRQDILNGDFRSLYLAWLAAAQYYHVEDNTFEPPVPNNLKKLSPTLKALVSYFELDQDLVFVASELSSDEEIGENDLEKYITRLPENEKNTFLSGIFKNVPDLNVKLVKKLRELAPKQENRRPVYSRSAEQLTNLASQYSIQRQEKIKKEKQAVRRIELQRLASRELFIWQEVENSICLKTSKGYDTAIKLLMDLKELATDQDNFEQYRIKMNSIQKDHGRLSSLMRRLHEKDLF